MNTSKRIVIVGGVAGGAGSAARLRRLSEETEIIMLEKGEFISFANCGLPYYLSGVINDKEKLLVQTVNGFSKRFNVDVRVFSEVINVNCKDKTIRVKNLNDSTEYDLSFDDLILSPGASPIIPKIPMSNKMPIFTLRNIPDTYKIKDFLNNNSPKSACVIGGGFIGIEVAENLTMAGVKVTIVEAIDHLMPNIDEDMSHSIHNHVRLNGVNLALRKLATEITEDGVLLSDGGFIPCDMVVMSVGVRPATAFLNNSSVELGEKGEILVDEHLKTSQDGIWAVGDAISVKNFVSSNQGIIPLAGPANKQARIVADNIMGRKSKYNGTQGTSIAKIFDMAVASTGLTERELINLKMDYHKAFSSSNHHASYYPNAKTMMIKLLFSKNDGLILGAQIVGSKGIDKRIDVIATAIRAKMTVFDLHELELSYAPPFSSAKDPVNMVGYVAENIMLGEVKVSTFKEVLSMGDEVIKLDVRTVGEVNRGSIEGFINIPLDSLRDRLCELDKSKHIHITCQSALRAYLALKILQNHGFTCFNIFGSYMWYSMYKADLEQKVKEEEINSNCARPELN